MFLLENNQKVERYWSSRIIGDILSLEFVNMLRKPRKPYFPVKDIHHTPKNLYMVIYNLNADKKTQGFKI